MPGTCGFAPLFTSVTMVMMVSSLDRWGGEPTSRQQAMPHIKSYLRYMPSTDAAGSARIAWAMLTSHNMSKPAWGVVQVSTLAPAYE